MNTQHCHSQIMKTTSSIRKSTSSPSLNKVAARSNAFQEDPFLSGRFDHDDGFFDSGFDNVEWGFDFAGVKDNFRNQDFSDTASGSSFGSGQSLQGNQRAGRPIVSREKNADGRSGDFSTAQGRKPTKSPIVKPSDSDMTTRSSSSSTRLCPNSRDSYPKTALQSRESTHKTSIASFSRSTHDAPGRALNHPEPEGVKRRSRTPTQGSRHEARNNPTKNSMKPDTANARTALNTSSHSAPAGESQRRRHHTSRDSASAGIVVGSTSSRGRQAEPMDMCVKRRANRSVSPKKNKSPLKSSAEEKTGRRSSIAVGEVARLMDGPTESFDERRHHYKMTASRGKSPHRNKPARESQEVPFEGKFQRRRSISNAAAAPVEIAANQPPPGMFPRRNSISNGEVAALQTFSLKKLSSHEPKSRNVTLLERQIAPLTSDNSKLTASRHGQRMETRRSGAIRPGRVEPLTHHHDSVKDDHVVRPSRGSQAATGNHHHDDRGRTPPHRRSTAESRRMNRRARNVQSETRAPNDSD